MSQRNADVLRTTWRTNSLRKKLESLKNDYDYILIDAPPNWTFYSISAVYAADVVLIPTKHDNIASLENAATFIQQSIREIQQDRQEKTQGLEWGTIALPIFFNNENNITNPARENTRSKIDSIIKEVKNKYNFDMTYYFFRNFNIGESTRIFELPHSAFIAKAAFNKIPAAYQYQDAYSYYTDLAKEYFLQ